MEMFINGMFWFGMYPFAMKHLWGTTGVVDFLILVLEHAVPLVFIIVELNVNNIVIWNYSYLIVLFFVLLGYLFVNVTYTLNVKPVYPAIDYRNALSYIFLGSCLLAIPICGYIARQYCFYCKEQRVKAILGIDESGAS